MLASKRQVKTFSTDIGFNGCSSVVAGSITGMHTAGDDWGSSARLLLPGSAVTIALPSTKTKRSLLSFALDRPAQ